MEGSVVVDCKDNRVEQNTEENDELEPTPGYQPYQTSSEFVLFLQTAKGFLRELKLSTSLPGRCVYGI